MRILAESLASAQEANERYPISKVEVFDTMLRWNLLNSGSIFDIDDVTEVGGVPSAGFDADIYDGEIWFSMMDTGNDLQVGRYISSAFNNVTNPYLSYGVRPSVWRDTVFFIGDTYDDPVCVSKVVAGGAEQTASCNITATPYEVNQWHAVAAVGANSFYHAFLTPSGSAASDFAVGIEYVSDASDVDTMPYTIPVDTEYSGASLSWFDAVSLDDGTDVIVVNTETHGHPEVILRRNGVWGEYFPMIPIDLVDNYSYLRIGWVKLFDGVLYATGELGRRGSSGRHPQSMAVVLRSSDGIHWSMDRWRYLGQTPFRSPLLLDGAYGYYLDLPSIYRSPLNPLFGLDEELIDANHVNIEIEDDILRWDSSMLNSSQVGSLRLNISNIQQKYSSPVSDSYLRPGYMLRLMAGYKTTHGSFYKQMHWYGIDTITPVAGSALNTLMLNCREWVGRSLADNMFDQDWQWSSPVRHYDNASQRDYLYAIEGSTVRTVDEEDLLRTEDVSPYSDAGNIKLYTEQKHSVIVSTRPFDAKDGFASVAFTVDGRYYLEGADSTHISITWRLGLNEYGLEYNLSEREHGLGAGPAIIKDAHNYVTCFLDTKSRQLILLRVTGDSDDETWEELARHDVSSVVNEVFVTDYWGSQLYEPWIRTRGNRIDYGLMVSSTGYEWHDPPTGYVARSTIEAYDQDFDTVSRFDYTISEVQRNGENRFGAVAGLGNPYVRITVHRENDIEPSFYYGRSLSDYNYGASIVDSESNGHMPYYEETGDFRWESFKDNFYGGFLYAQSNSLGRGKCYSNTLVDGSHIAATQRGDYVTGLWEIMDSSASASNRINIELDPDSCYPPGEDGSYWLANLASSDASSDAIDYSGFWFMDGELEGHWLPAESITYAPDWTMDGDNIRFVLVTNEDSPTTLPAVGDKVIYSPGAVIQDIDERFRGSYKFSWNPEPVGVTIRSFAASNLVHEKSIQWVLDDIVSKAGVIDQYGGLSSGAREYSLNYNFSGSGASCSISDELKDFDLSVSLSEMIAANNHLRLIYGGRFGSTDGVYVYLEKDSGGNMGIILDSHYSGKAMSHFTNYLYQDIVEAKNFRFVKQGNYISVWAEDNLVLSYPLRERWPGCSFSETFMDYGRVMFTLTQAGSFTVRQEKLWEPVEDVISSQGTNPLQAANLVIRDAHIKILPDETMALRISVFDERDDAGVIPDVIFSDRQELTDALPTHIRVTGEEIGEYFDHATAAEYGVLFTPRTVESLDEDEAYDEAERMVKDALGANEGRYETVGAQLHLEPEDQVEVTFETPDGMQVTGDYIINAIQLSSSPPTMEMSLQLRKKYA